VYSFPKEGKGMASRTNKFCNGNFSNPVHSKDGYVVCDCENPKYMKVLEFLVLILNLERPTRVTVTLGNILLGALSGDRKVNWRIVIWALVARMYTIARKTKPFGLSPFVFRLYQSLDLLRDRERSVYKVLEVILQYNISSESEAEATKEESGEESSDLEKEKVVAREKGKGLVERTKKKDPILATDQKDDPLSKVIEDLKGTRDHLASERDVSRSDVRKLEDRVEDLSDRVKTLQAKLKKKSEEVVRRLSPETTETLIWIQNFIKNPGDVVNKAKLFEAKVLKEKVQLGSKIVSMLVDYGEKIETILLEMRAIILEIGLESETWKGSSWVIKAKATPSKVIPSLSSLASLERKVKGIMKTPQSTRPTS